MNFEVMMMMMIMMMGGIKIWKPNKYVIVDKYNIMIVQKALSKGPDDGHDEEVTSRIEIYELGNPGTKLKFKTLMSDMSAKGVCMGKRCVNGKGMQGGIICICTRLKIIVGKHQVFT